MPVVLHRWRTPTTGNSFLLVVATESLAVLAARLAVSERAAWLAWASLVPLGLGLLAYVVVLSRFDVRQLFTGHGDHWVAGGALAIATLACGRAAQAAETFSSLAAAAPPLRLTALGVWTAAAWLLPLLAGELAAPRAGSCTARRSTVFPVGMFATCSFATGQEAGLPRPRRSRAHVDLACARRVAARRGRPAATRTRCLVRGEAGRIAVDRARR